MLALFNALSQHYALALAAVFAAALLEAVAVRFPCWSYVPRRQNSVRGRKNYLHHFSSSTYSVGRATPATLCIGIKPADALVDSGAAQIGITQICAFEVGAAQISFA